jgi:AhpD family alkylhydroperoxidase
MKARIKNPALALPGALEALQAASKATKSSGLAPETVNLVHIRASQINGCSVCLDMHTREARRVGESDDRLFTVAAWRDAPFFSDAERAALALTEAATRLSDEGDAVPDGIWDEAARHYDEPALAALVMEIAIINLWNRINVTTRQVAGAFAG